MIRRLIAASRGDFELERFEDARLFGRELLVTP